MEKIKSSSIAGMFYPDDKKELEQMIKNFARFDLPFSTRAVIVPHAGLIYSGELAFNGINLLKKNLKTIFIFAPAHRVAFDGIALSGYDFFQTPFGNIKINKEICLEIKDKFDAKFYNEAFLDEHAIEIQLPSIQTIFKETEIVPILFGREAPSSIEKIISHYYSNQDTGFIISSDLSHFLTDENAKKLDNYTAQMIETGYINNFNFDQACGAAGIMGLVMFANKNDFSLSRIDMINSSNITNDKTRVVGYGAWALFEGEKNEFIKKYYSDFILDLCKKSIKKESLPVSYPKVFDEFGACFVTLEKENNLRGCIGSIIAHKPLIEDLFSNAKNSAFHDPRFMPVQDNEIENLKIKVSLLSNPKDIKFDSEEDLLNKIKPFEDGIIIKDKEYQAVFLPLVWEEIPNKEAFIKALKLKAGMEENHFSETFMAYKFKTVCIE